MNTNQIHKNNDHQITNDLSLVEIEVTTRPSLWERMKNSFLAPSMDLETWERLEMKKTRSSYGSSRQEKF